MSNQGSKKEERHQIQVSYTGETMTESKPATTTFDKEINCDNNNSDKNQETMPEHLILNSPPDLERMYDTINNRLTNEETIRDNVVMKEHAKESTFLDKNNDIQISDECQSTLQTSDEDIGSDSLDDISDGKNLETQSKTFTVNANGESDKSMIESHTLENTTSASVSLDTESMSVIGPNGIEVTEKQSDNVKRIGNDIHTSIRNTTNTPSPCTTVLAKQVDGVGHIITNAPTLTISADEQSNCETNIGDAQTKSGKEKKYISAKSTPPACFWNTEAEAETDLPDDHSNFESSSTELNIKPGQYRNNAEAHKESLPANQPYGGSGICKDLTGTNITTNYQSTSHRPIDNNSTHLFENNLNEVDKRKNSSNQTTELSLRSISDNSHGNTNSAPNSERLKFETVTEKDETRIDTMSGEWEGSNENRKKLFDISSIVATVNKTSNVMRRFTKKRCRWSLGCSLIVCSVILALHQKSNRLLTFDRPGIDGKFHEVVSKVRCHLAEYSVYVSWMEPRNASSQNDDPIHSQTLDLPTPNLPYILQNAAQWNNSIPDQITVTRNQGRAQNNSLIPASNSNETLMSTGLEETLISYLENDSSLSSVAAIDNLPSNITAVIFQTIARQEYREDEDTKEYIDSLTQEKRLSDEFNQPTGVNTVARTTDGEQITSIYQDGTNSADTNMEYINTTRNNQNLSVAPILDLITPSGEFQESSTYGKLSFRRPMEVSESPICDNTFAQYSNFSILESETPNTWPHDSPTLAELTEAGFYFTGIGDIVRCFECDKCMQQWKPDDIPLVEHRKLSPRCPFIKQFDKDTKKASSRRNDKGARETGDTKNVECEPPDAQQRPVRFMIRQRSKLGKELDCAPFLNFGNNGRRNYEESLRAIQTIRSLQQELMQNLREADGHRRRGKSNSMNILRPGPGTGSLLGLDISVLPVPEGNQLNRESPTACGTSRLPQDDDERSNERNEYADEMCLSNNSDRSTTKGLDKNDIMTNENTMLKMNTGIRHYKRARKRANSSYLNKTNRPMSSKMKLPNLNANLNPFSRYSYAELNAKESFDDKSSSINRDTQNVWSENNGDNHVHVPNRSRNMPVEPIHMANTLRTRSAQFHEHEPQRRTSSHVTGTTAVLSSGSEKEENTCVEGHDHAFNEQPQNSRIKKCCKASNHTNTTLSQSELNKNGLIDGSDVNATIPKRLKQQITLVEPNERRVRPRSSEQVFDRSGSMSRNLSETTSVVRSLRRHRVPTSQIETVLESDAGLRVLEDGYARPDVAMAVRTLLAGGARLTFTYELIVAALMSLSLYPRTRMKRRQDP